MASVKGGTRSVLRKPISSRTKQRTNEPKGTMWTHSLLSAETRQYIAQNHGASTASGHDSNYALQSEARCGLCTYEAHQDCSGAVV